MLSPLYDVNPVPYGDDLAINVNGDDRSTSIGSAIDTAWHFGIDEDTAIKMADEIVTVVRDNWEKLAQKYGIPKGMVEDMRPAFNECYQATSS